MSVKATGFGIVLHKNNGGGSKICINAQKVRVLREDTGDSEDEEECLFAPASKKARAHRVARRGQCTCMGNPSNNFANTNGREVYLVRNAACVGARTARTELKVSY